MVEEIKAIPTEYKDVIFRSRLEAQWAEWFDEHEIVWSYETEGFDLDGVWYLPDFYLPEINTVVEVKGVFQGIEKANALFLAIKKLDYEIVLKEWEKLDEKEKEDYSFPYFNWGGDTPKENFAKCGSSWLPKYIFLLGGSPVPALYDIDGCSYAISSCAKCGKYWIYDMIGGFDCRACGEYKGDHHLCDTKQWGLGDYRLLQTPRGWKMKEEDRQE